MINAYDSVYIAIGHSIHTEDAKVFLLWQETHTLGQNLLIVKVWQMDYNYDFNLSKKRKTFLSLSQKENVQTLKTLSNILLIATTSQFC